MGIAIDEKLDLSCYTDAEFSLQKIHRITGGSMKVLYYLKQYFDEEENPNLTLKKIREEIFFSKNRK